MKRDLTEMMEEAITGSTSISNLAEGIQKPTNALFSAPWMRPVKTFLNGTWLEHPLHPVITDVPIGAWTASILLDLVSLVYRVRNLGKASAIVSGLGTVSALGAAVPTRT